jgi:hypothetical protein
MSGELSAVALRSTMDFDSIADELYAGDPADFTATRDARAREAKTGGDRTLADRIRKLRKPTAAAAAVNRLPREELQELAELGKSLRKAHAELAGADLRELSRRRHEVIQTLLRRAPKMTDAVAREVEATLEAAVGSPEAAEEVLGGRLGSALSPDAAAPWPTATVTPKPKPAPMAKPARVAEPAPVAEPKPDKERVKRERQERERLEQARAKLAQAVSAAEAELTKAEKRAETASKTADELREKLAQAEEANAAEQASVETATQALADAEQALRDFDA